MFSCLQYNMRCVILVVSLAMSGRATWKFIPPYKLTLGEIGPEDQLLYKNQVFTPPLNHTGQYQDLIYRTEPNMKITAIRVIPVGDDKNGIPYIYSGGLGYNRVTIRITSDIGDGFYYAVGIWGRENDDQDIWSRGFKGFTDGLTNAFNFVTSARSKIWSLIVPFK